MTAEELVEAVDPGHEPRGRPAAAPARPHICRRLAGPREPGADRRVELPMSIELERVGRNHRQQVAAGEPRLYLPPLLRCVAGPVGSDPLGRSPRPRRSSSSPVKRWISSTRKQLPTKQIVRAPSDEVGSMSAASARTERRGAAGAIGERRVPHRDPARGLRRAVGVDQLELGGDEALGELERVGDRRRGQMNLVRAVHTGHPAQPPEHVGDVGAEDAAVDVRLVDDDEAELRDELRPALVMGEQADVDHVGVRQDQVRTAPDRGALLARGVTVVDRVPQTLGRDLGLRWS